MSRRYPDQIGSCPDCGHPLMGNPTEIRPHGCKVGWDGTPTPWPWYTLESAARRLNVSPERLSSLGGKDGPLRRHKVVRLADVGVPGVHGEYRYNREDVDALAEVVNQ